MRFGWSKIMSSSLGRRRRKAVSGGAANGIADEDSVKASRAAIRHSETNAEADKPLVEHSERPVDDPQVGVGGPRLPRSVRIPSPGLAAGASLLVALGGLTGWLGYQAFTWRHAELERAHFLQVGRQGALNLATISDAKADSDIQRILDSSTGTFHDQIQQRSHEFVALIKQAQSNSVGTLIEAGIESEQAGQAKVLVALNVKASVMGAADAPARSWRMRVTVEQVGTEAKISNVEFVP